MKDRRGSSDEGREVGGEFGGREERERRDESEGDMKEEMRSGRKSEKEDRKGQGRYSNEMNKEKGAEREDDEKLRWDPLKENVVAERGGGERKGT